MKERENRFLQIIVFEVNREKLDFCWGSENPSVERISSVGRPFCLEEIDEAVFLLPIDKALGSSFTMASRIVEKNYGWPSGCFWEFYSHGKLSKKGINTTLISVAPKKKVQTVPKGISSTLISLVPKKKMQVVFQISEL